MATWAIQNFLARGERPGYPSKSVQRAEVNKWLANVRELGVAAIICLLADDQLPIYAALPGGLVSYYREAGFLVEHLPVQDHQKPPLSANDLDKVWRAYLVLPRPILIHRSAGLDRTGLAVKYIQSKVNPLEV